MVQTHILYVETNRNFQASLKKTLEDRHNSFNITLSESAEDALEKLHEENFQCVLSDYTLSDMDGTELLQKVRESHPELPFFLLMENNDASVQKTAIEHNVTDCFNKETLHPHLLENNIDAFTTNYTITQNKNKETLQQIDPEILQQIFEQVPASLYIKDTEGRHLFMSDYDTSPEEALGKTDLEIYPEEVAKESYKDDIKVIRTGEPIRNKEEYNEVTDKWTITSKVPWYGKNEEINGLIGVTRFITEQKEQEQDLEKKKKRLEQFASVVSHDLRNPLSVADGYMQIAKEETGSEHLEPAIEALDRMNTLINELLQLAKGETKEDERTNTTLYNLFSEAWSNVDTKAATYSIDGRKQLKANKCRLKQLFENLIRNSVEHGGKDVTIEIGKLETGFYYQDDGPGIPDERKSEAFDFGATWSDDGTGFGLAIVEEIARAHDWEITLTDSETGGVRFEFQTEKPIDTTTDSTRQKRSAGNNSLDAPPALPKGEKP